MDILNAARRNDCKLLQRLLRKGLDPDIPHEKQGKTALHVSCSLGNLSAIQLLIRGKANPSIQDKKGNTPLHCAVLANPSVKIVEYLIEEGADINSQNIRGYTPLLLAISSGYEDVAHFLIDSGTDVELRSHDGKTALMLAAINGFVELTKKLLGKDANVWAKDDNGKDILHYAIVGGNINLYLMIEAIFTQQNLENLDYSEALLIAAQKGFARIIDHLLKKLPCDINFINEMRQSALHIAVQGKHKKTAKVLLKKGITVDRRDHGILGANTTLIYAAKQNMCSIIQALLKAGADLEKTNVEQKTAMFYAAERGHVEATRVLLEAFQKRVLEKRTITGEEIWHYQSPLQVIMQSPLEAAVVNEHTKIVDMLLKAGMARKLKSALLYASRKGSFRIVKAIVRYVNSTAVTESLQSHFPSQANWIKAMALAVTNGHLEIVKMFVQHGFSQSFGYDFVRSPILNTKTALHLAAGGGYIKIVRLLLRNHADPEAIDELGNSPFLYAVEMNKTAVAKHLLTGQCRGQPLIKFIDVHRKGTAALHLAAQNGNDELLDCLIKAGCSPEIQAMWPITAGFPPSVEHRLNSFYPVVLTVMKRNFGATVCLLNHSCSLAVSSNVNMTNLTPLQCTIKFNDPLMFRCLVWSGNLPLAQGLRQIRSILATDNQLSIEIREWVRHALSLPMNLQDLTRVKIRQSISGSKQAGFKTLLLPSRLEAFLQLQDFVQNAMATQSKEAAKYIFHHV